MRVGSIIHEYLDMLAACFLPGRAKDLSAPLYIVPRPTPIDMILPLAVLTAYCMTFVLTTRN
jgi:hypothetical protein